MRWFMPVGNNRGGQGVPRLTLGLLDSMSGSMSGIIGDRSQQKGVSLWTVSPGDVYVRNNDNGMYGHWHGRDHSCCAQPRNYHTGQDSIGSSVHHFRIIVKIYACVVPSYL